MCVRASSRSTVLCCCFLPHKTRQLAKWQNSFLQNVCQGFVFVFVFVYLLNAMIVIQTEHGRKLWLWFIRCQNIIFSISQCLCLCGVMCACHLFLLVIVLLCNFANVEIHLWHCTVFIKGVGHNYTIIHNHKQTLTPVGKIIIKALQAIVEAPYYGFILH